MSESDCYSQRNYDAIQTDKSAQEIFFDNYLESLVSYFSEEKEQNSIRWAYNFAKKAHGDKERQSGQLYFGHIIAVTQVLVEEYGEINADYVKALLLHDVGEDTCELGFVYMREMPYDIYNMSYAAPDKVGSTSC